ncbi:sensor histidine kinase [Herpetosiphon giganteus]|uniref:sensor histidine kinase n=1 Tax=Herpetosiphon giganteus TaxID=2029754 RepID=UPI00195C200B|nr:sensor histidine kinase [Herpetosiphon giganteus]MBM7841494.1 signal transduction histidine kinase [Herpetosiphon giganteus]
MMLPESTPTEQQTQQDRIHGQSLSWSGIIAGLVACIVPLIIGVSTGSLYGWRLAVYIAAGSCYFLLKRVFWAETAFCLRMRRYPQLLISVVFGLAALMQLISGDFTTQPIAFMVPMVFIAGTYPLPKTLVIAGFISILMSACFILAGLPLNSMGFSGLSSQIVLLLFVTLFGYVTNQSVLTRHQVEQLAQELAQERDYLRQLSASTAALSSEVELSRVLAQVAEAGRTLANAQAVTVALREDSEWRIATSIGSPEPNQHSLEIALHAKGEAIGRLTCWSAEPANAALRQALQPFADAAALAIYNAQLYEQARFSATLAERNRLARDFHDTLAQQLTGLRLQIEAGMRNLHQPEKAQIRLQKAYDLALAALHDLRRSVWNLSAPAIDGRVLNDVLAELVDTFHQRTNIQSQYSHDGQELNLPSEMAIQVLRVVNEALSNVEKHAQAQHVAIRSTVAAGQLQITVSDDGQGFELATVQQTASGGFGLTSMRERTQLIHGTLSIQSQPTAGTLLTLCLPL